ncbi:TPA: ankyrin repeat domain-containing protein [Legionella anisa]
MFNSFKTLYADLKLTPHYEKEAALTRLENWCTSYISQDISYTGSEEERYRSYLSLTQNFLDDFLAIVTKEAQTRFDGMNAIQYAAFKGYDHFLSQFVPTHPELLNEENKLGMTALHFAALKGHIHSVKVLLNANILPNKVNKDREFPIHSALFLANKMDQELKKRKIELFNILKNAAPFTMNAVTLNGETVAHLMAKNGFTNLLEDLAKEHSILLFTKNNHGKYPIHLAILNQQLQTVERLITIPGIEELRDAEKRCALHYAAAFGNVEMIKACVITKNYLNARDAYQKTPLIRAAESGNLEAVQFLVELGAEVGVVDLEGFTILDYALQNQNTKLKEWIQQNTSLKNPTMRTINTPWFSSLR